MSRFVLSILTIAAIAFSAVAEEQPRFLIERIEVRNTHRVSADLIKSESLLHEGSEYSEQELSAAAARLTRLPFLLSTEFKLEKGTSRGQYVLAIIVNETKPFFYLIDAHATVVGDRTPSDFNDDVDPAIESKDGALGVRWFVGGHGVVYAGTTTRHDHDVLTSDYTAIAIGYTQYDLFGTRAFASINLRRTLNYGAGGISPQLVAGVPLTTNQTLTLDYEDTILSGGLHHHESERLISLTWAYDTTNQPFVPTRGTLIRVTPLRSMRDRSGFAYIAPFPTPGPQPYTEHISGAAVDALAARYWEVSDRNSVSAAVVAGWARVDENPDIFFRRVTFQPAYEVLRGAWSHDIWKGDPRGGDSRIELAAAIASRQRNVSNGLEAFGMTPNNETSFLASASWVRRSSWGFLRIGAGYAWAR